MTGVYRGISNLLRTVTIEYYVIIERYLRGCPIGEKLETYLVNMLKDLKYIERALLLIKVCIKIPECFFYVFWSIYVL